MKRLFVVAMLILAGTALWGYTYLESENNNTEPERNQIPYGSPSVDVYGWDGGNSVDLFKYYVRGEDFLRMTLVEGAITVTLKKADKSVIGVLDTPGEFIDYQVTDIPLDVLGLYYFDVDPAAIDYHIHIENFTHDTLPVELTSFLAVETSSNAVQLRWITQSETDMAGYNLYRNMSDDPSTAIRQNNDVIQATNSSEGGSYTYTDADVIAGGTYYYWLESVDLNGTVNTISTVNIALSVPETPGEIDNFSNECTHFIGNSPNPFNPLTVISYFLAEDSPVQIDIYNLKGQKVRTFSTAMQTAGTHSLQWNGLDGQGKEAGTGIYFFRMTAGSTKMVMKGTLLK